MWIWLWTFAVIAALIFGIDFLLRRKRWNQNTREEKRSLVISLICVPFYTFLSALGMLWGIAEPATENAFCMACFRISAGMGTLIWIVALGATLAGLILRKTGRVRQSKMVHAFGMGYLGAFLLLGFMGNMI